MLRQSTEPAPDRAPAAPRGRRRSVAIPAALTVLAVLAVGGAVAVARLAHSDGEQAAAADVTPSAPVASGSLPESGAAPSPGASQGLGARPTTSGSATPSATKPSAATALTGFPAAGNTGVPDGVRLSAYSGPCTITRANTVIDKRQVRCSLLIKAKNVVIKSSQVDGTIRLEGASHSVRIEDSVIDGGQAYAPTVGFENVTVLRSEIRGGQHNVNCYRNCLVQDSWLHGQYLPDGGDWHLNAFLSNGGSDIQLVHNTLACDRPTNAAGGGCTANASIFGDFGPNTNYTIRNNLFVASEEMSYCFYGGYEEHKKYGTQVSGIVVTGNVFQRGRNGKCGAYGPATSWARSAPGNVWQDNVWSDGKTLPPD
ncbi:hypothetical protein C1I95_30900 [Micromonospora craterilacus]|uniref:Right handed beta helix domain-containing protein n=1 Tax=Micromonospora craterilacus TaxID=1655439 RepID=A0A2W2DTU5_9ACTN|nr:hypothetical protein C1I95_30900 [Micromonospora craterilacus]